MPEISCIITSYNRLALLKESTRSVQDQTFADWECVVIDDHSRDGSPEFLNELSREDRRFIWITSDLEPSRVDVCRLNHNVNQAIRYTSGKYLTFLMEDDLYLPHRFQRMKEKLDTTPEAWIVYGSQQTVKWNGSEWIPEEPYIREAVPLLANAVQVIDFSSVMCRRNLIDLVGGFPEGEEYWLRADIGFWERIQAIGIGYHGIPDILDIHRQTGHGLTAALNEVLNSRKVYSNDK